MKKKLEYVWPFIGLLAVGFSIYLLKEKLEGVTAADIGNALAARGPGMMMMCVASTGLAYAALAWYDRIALMHVGRVLSWPVVSTVSFCAYALGHNIGVSVLSSGLVRYRAYSRYGLSVGEVAIVTAFCAFTFAYGAILLAGVVLVGEPAYVSQVLARVSQVLAGNTLDIHTSIVALIGVAILMLIALYQLGSILHFRPLVVRGFTIAYPRPPIAFRQLFAAPLEVIGAAAIIYFALPDTLNPGFFAVLGIFLASFSAGLLAQAPGALGVFETFFLAAILPVGTFGAKDPASVQMQAQVLAALLVFRLLYLIIPLAISCVMVLVFERKALSGAIGRLTGRKTQDDAPLPEPVKLEPSRTDQ